MHITAFGNIGEPFFLFSVFSVVVFIIANSLWYFRFPKMPDIALPGLKGSSTFGGSLKRRITATSR